MARLARNYPRFMMHDLCDVLICIECDSKWQIGAIMVYMK